MKYELLEAEVRGVLGRRECAHCNGVMFQFVKTCHRCEAPAVTTGEAPARSLDKPTGARRIAHLSDLHLGVSRKGPSPLDVLRAWLEVYRDVGADVVAVSGDIVETHNDVASLTAARRSLDDSRMPWVVTPGNHDVCTPGIPGHFERTFGEYPRRQRVGGVDFALVDSNAGLPVRERTWLEQGFMMLKCPTEGRVGKEQMTDFDADIGQSDAFIPRVLVLHHHLVHQSPDPVVPWLPFLKEDAIGTMAVLQDADALRDWAVRAGVRVVLHGHKHRIQRAGYHGKDLLVLNAGSSTKSVSSDASIHRYVARTVDLLPSGERRVSTLQLML